MNLKKKLRGRTRLIRGKHGMKTVVIYASKHGTTRQYAARIAVENGTNLQNGGKNEKFTEFS
jgi:hypothetical protein